MNIVDLIKGQLGSMLPGALSSVLGTNADAAKGAMNAGLPALLAGLSSVASTPDGAQRLNQAVDAADDGLLSKLPGLISGGAGGLGSLVNGGGNILGSLLGGGLSSGLVGILGKFLGLGAGASSLLGLLAPIILGFLKGQKKTMGLDAGGLASMLAGQKSNIMAALPAGLGAMMKDVPGMQGFASMPSAPSTPAYTPAPQSSAAQPSGGGLGKLLVPLLLIGALAAGAYYFLSGNKAPTTPKVPNVTAPKDDMPKVDMLKVPDTAQFTGEVTDFFKTATSSLGTITDAKSAMDAMPKLKDLGGKLDLLNTGLGAFSGDAKTGLIATIKQAAGPVLPMIEKITGFAGLDGGVKTLLDGMIAKIKAMAGM
jgi:Bacterial protein of unknown function (DUF937)